MLPVLVNGMPEDLSVTVHNATEREKDGYKGEVFVEEYFHMSFLPNTLLNITKKSA